MDTENTLYFYSKSIEELDIDYQAWKGHFVDSFEYVKNGIVFVLVQRQRGDCILYIVRMYFDVNMQMYIEEIQKISEFTSYEEAYDKCNQVIESMYEEENKEDER
jgi:hypothetical protein